MEVNGYRHFENQKSIYRQHKINSWRYVEVLWSKMTGLCKKRIIIYNIITCNPEPQAKDPVWHLVHEWIILLNGSFWWTIRTNSPNRTESSESVCSSSSTDVLVTQSKLDFRCLTVTPTGNEPKQQRIRSCDEWIIRFSSSSYSHWTRNALDM